MLVLVEVLSGQVQAVEVLVVEVVRVKGRASAKELSTKKRTELLSPGMMALFCLPWPICNTERKKSLNVQIRH